MKVLGLLFLLIAPLQASGYACFGTDREVYDYVRYETMPCTTSGYCYAYDYNPQTGQYEYFYGYHINCDGVQERQVREVTCERNDGTRYTQPEYGFWGMCQVR